MIGSKKEWGRQRSKSSSRSRASNIKKLKKITLGQVLSNNTSLNILMQHLAREFSMECLLSLIEFIQFQNYVFEYIAQNYNNYFIDSNNNASNDNWNNNRLMFALVASGRNGMENPYGPHTWRSFNTRFTPYSHMHNQKHENSIASPKYIQQLLPPDNNNNNNNNNNNINISNNNSDGKFEFGEYRINPKDVTDNLRVHSIHSATGRSDTVVDIIDENKSDDPIAIDMLDIDIVNDYRDKSASPNSDHDVTHAPDTPNGSQQHIQALPDHGSQDTFISRQFDKIAKMKQLQVHHDKRAGSDTDHDIDSEDSGQPGHATVIQTALTMSLSDINDHDNTVLGPPDHHHHDHHHHHHHLHMRNDASCESMDSNTTRTSMNLGTISSKVMFNSAGIDYIGMLKSKKIDEKLNIQLPNELPISSVIHTIRKRKNKRVSQEDEEKDNDVDDEEIGSIEIVGGASDDENDGLSLSDKWFENAKYKAFLLYQKYVELGCKYEVNLSYQTRNIICDLMSDNMNNIENELILFWLFDEASMEMIQLIKGSFSRFKLSARFNKFLKDCKFGK